MCFRSAMPSIPFPAMIRIYGGVTMSTCSVQYVRVKARKNINTRLVFQYKCWLLHLDTRFLLGWSVNHVNTRVLCQIWFDSQESSISTMCFWRLSACVCCAWHVCMSLHMSTCIHICKYMITNIPVQLCIVHCICQIVWTVVLVVDFHVMLQPFISRFMPKWKCVSIYKCIYIYTHMYSASLCLGMFTLSFSYVDTQICVYRYVYLDHLSLIGTYHFYTYVACTFAFEYLCNLPP